MFLGTYGVNYVMARDLPSIDINARWWDPMIIKWAQSKPYIMLALSPSYMYAQLGL